MSWMARAYNSSACKLLNLTIFSKSTYDFYYNHERPPPTSQRTAKIISEVVTRILTKRVV